MFRVVLVLFFLSSLAAFSQRTALIGAMPEEIAGLQARMQSLKEVKRHDIVFYKGKLAGKKVVLMKCGVGKVNAAYSTALLLENFKITAILFSGVAGGIEPTIVPGDVVIASSTFHHDFARHLAENYEVRATYSMQAGQKNPMYFKSDSTLFDVAFKAAEKISYTEVAGHKPEVFTGKIATGDVFLSNAAKARELFENFDAIAVEMEGAAVAQIAYQRSVPCLIIRSISDNANNEAHVDFNVFKYPAAENAALLVEEILKGM